MLCQALRVFAPLHQGWQLPIQGNAYAALAAALEEEMAVGLCRKFAFLRPNVKIVC